ncbi:MAG: COQ9 family protein [Hyphomonadaceae bacterium]
MEAPFPSPALALRDRLLDAMLEAAGQQGWNAAALAQAGEAAGLTAGEVELAAPRGAGGLIEAWAARSDAAMAAILGAADLAALKVRERVRLAVRARIETDAAHRDAARRAAAHLALAPAQAARMAWRTADAIWRALGDPSTDGNFYSKRAILSGVFAAVFACWLTDETPGFRRTWDFLDARIENVMQFEKLKAQRLAPMTGLAVAAAVGALARLRYGAEARES